jgi:D-3-phosphoglycerate dehydrogenase / 2-oxoglutarate reductase
MHTILIADSLPENILARYNKIKDISIDNKAGILKEELIKIIPEYDGLVVRSRTKATADIIEAGKKLKVIGRAGAGVDNIEVPAATKMKIIVMNTPGGNTIAATEHTIALLLAILRQIPQASMSMRNGQWDKKSFSGHEIFEKTVGVIGLGKIGFGVAKRLAAFEAKILAFDPLIKKDTAKSIGARLVSLEELLQQADIITVHAPKNPETMNLINQENLGLCKQGVVIINCARGGIINEADLLAALDSGKVAAAGLDVFSSEPPVDFTLAKHPRVVSTPHLGASTEEAQIKVADMILEQMVEYFQKNKVRNAVNYPFKG